MLKSIQENQRGGNVWQLKIILSFITMLVLLFSTTLVAFASDNTQKVDTTEKAVKLIAEVEGLAIYQYEDGRIKGIENQSLSEGQTKMILSKMGFTADEINNMPSELQQEIAQSGGKKVEPTLLEWTRKVHSPDGKIVEEVIYDGNEYSSDIDLMSFQSVPNLDLYCIYKNQTSTHADYDYYAKYDWEVGSPMLGLTDINAIAWDSDTKFLDNATFIAKYRPNASAPYKDTSKRIEYGITGTALHVDCITQAYGQYGYIRELVRVPRGTTVNCVQKYAHKYTPGTLGVNIGIADINFNGSSNYYEDSKRFKLPVN